MNPIRLITLAPGHFHAALVQKRMLPGVDPNVSVFAPLDRDLAAHIERIAGFNTRVEEPTAWNLDVHAGNDYLERFAREQQGNTVMLSGRNRPKIDLMLLAVSLGLNVLADKPWIVDTADFPKVEQVLREAEARGVLVWDMMTERHEVTSQLQRELIRMPAVFGEWASPSGDMPALLIESVHCLKKTVAGRPLIRPWWWFDSDISGDAIADVGTHLADLAMWFIAPEQAIEINDIHIQNANRWALELTEEQFAACTGLPGFPPELASQVVSGHLPYDGNNTVTYTLRGVPVKLIARWEYESSGSGDTHSAIARGTKATVAIHQSPEANSQPELYVTATNPSEQPQIVAALQLACAGWQKRYPGTRIAERGDLAHVVIPRKLRIGHEAHFAEVFAEFVRYFQNSSEVPAWEKANVLAKYHLTTMAVAYAKRKHA